MIQSLGKIVQWSLTKVNIALPNNPAITILGIFWIDLKIYVHTKTCMWMFIAVFNNHPKLEATKISPTFSRWMEKQTVVHPYNGKIFIKKKKKAVRPQNDLEETWTWLNERRQHEKATYFVFPVIWHSGKGKIIEMVNWPMTAREFGERKSWINAVQGIF